MYNNIIGQYLILLCKVLSKNTMKEINYNIDIDFADEFANKYKIDASKFNDNMIFSMK